MLFMMPHLLLLQFLYYVVEIFYPQQVTHRYRVVQTKVMEKTVVFLIIPLTHLLQKVLRYSLPLTPFATPLKSVTPTRKEKYQIHQSPPLLQFARPFVNVFVNFG